MIESVLECSNARLSKIQGPSHNYQFGLLLVKNGISYEFFSPDEKIIDNWFHCLRQFCILTNFHDEYKAIKMIGKGSFAKVIHILTILFHIISSLNRSILLIVSRQVRVMLLKLLLRKVLLSLIKLMLK